MGFDDLEEGLKDQEERDEQPKREFDTTAATDPVETRVPDTKEPSTDSRDQPAFSFDETKQDALYALPEGWDAFNDMLDLELEQELRDRGLRDVPKREKHQAALVVVSRYADEIADEIEHRR